MTRQIIADLIRAEALSPHYAAIVERWWQPLAAAIAERHATLGRGALIGINGAQGTGKSTLCLFLEVLLRERYGLRVATLSLDDLYLLRTARQELARTVHPLFATRGVPGTHDVALGGSTIEALLGRSGPVSVPRFDKASDDRIAEADWPSVDAPVDIVLFEGWCVGAGALEPAALIQPINALERDEDPDARWRSHANTMLAGPYARLFVRLDMLVMLAPPGFAEVRAWRALQERKLRAKHGRGMTEGEVARFVDHYERLTRHMLATMPERADIVIRIGADHDPVAMD